MTQPDRGAIGRLALLWGTAALALFIAACRPAAGLPAEPLPIFRDWLGTLGKRRPVSRTFTSTAREAISEPANGMTGPRRIGKCWPIAWLLE